MARGRKPTPTAVNELRGNPGKRARPAAALDVPIVATGDPRDVVFPPAPAGLGPRGTDLWERSWRICRRYLSEADREILLMACEVADQRDRLMTIIRAKDGLDVADLQAKREVDKPRAWRDYVMLRSAEAQLTTWLSMLAMSPTDRARAAFPEAVDQGDPIAEARRREQARQDGYRRTFGT